MLDHHGYDGLQPELNMMSKQGQWREMTERIDDELLDLLTVSGRPSEVGRKLVERNTFANRSTMMFYGPTPSPETMAEVVDSIRTASSP